MSPRDEICEMLGHAVDEYEILFADGFDDAIVGVVERITAQPVVLYDRERCIEILMGKGMDRLEAEEYFDYNVTGSWVGEGTPAFVSFIPGSTWTPSTSS